MTENAAQGTQEIDEKRSKSWPITLRARFSERPRASKMPSWSFRWPPDLRIMLNTAELCEIIQENLQHMLTYVKIEQHLTETGEILLNVGRTSHKMMNSRGRR